MTPLSREDLIKHWLLNTAINFPRPLLHVLPRARGITLNAIEVPGCLAEDYAIGLSDLYQSGHICFTSEDPEDDVRSVFGIAAILGRFMGYSIEMPEERYAHRDRRADPQAAMIPRVQFALTESGGALWENLAKPDWDQFYGELTDYESGEMFSPDLTLLMARMGWSSELLGDRTIDIQSIEFEEHSDYPVLYWKKLPHVYRATFKCYRSEPRWPRRPNFEFRPAPAWFESWRRTTYRFYTQPWELPYWPSA